MAENKNLWTTVPWKPHFVKNIPVTDDRRTVKTIAITASWCAVKTAQ